MKNNFDCVLLVTLALVVGQIIASDTKNNSVTTDVPTTTPLITTTSKPVTSTSQKPDVTTQTADELCRKFSNGTCDQCLGVSGAKCLWCKSDSTCMAYPINKVLPGKDDCALDEARWGVCWLNFEALIIGVSVTGGILILALTICICRCCCCRGNNKKKYAKEEARYDSQKMERKAKNDERRAERKDRLDEIRRKYGLMKDEPYQRFDA